MQYTPNYNMTIAEGTDTVNLLTQSYPNFSTLDTVVKEVSDNAITSAAETKVGTVHNLVRTSPDRTIIKFTATSNYTTGDTFTVDGVAVTAVTTGGTALKTGAFLINSNVLCILNNLVLTVLVSEANADASDISFDNTGTGLLSTDVQNAIEEVNTNVSNVSENVNTYVSGTILAGSTTITLSDLAIQTTSFIDVYFKDKLIAPVNVTVVTGSVTVEIEAEATDTDVAVRIANL